MKKIFWLSIFKSSSLIVLTLATAVFIFTSYITLLQYYIYLGICSVLYLGFQVFEINLQASLNRKETTVYLYKTDATVAKYLLRAILFLMAGLVLYFSVSVIKFMSFLCFLISVSDIFMLIYKRTMDLLFIAIGDTFVNIFTTNQESVYAKELEKINYRHGMTYLIKKDKKAVTLRTDVMPDRQQFIGELKAWAEKNGVPQVIEP